MTRWSLPSRRNATVVAIGALALCACGGSGDPAGPEAPVPVTAAPVANAPMPAPGRGGGAMTLPPPVLSFNDTGLSVSDGVTRNGLWSVDSALDWEFSLDQGRTWVRGSGGQFEVTGDGPKMIWVRARDDLGNTSPIVVVTCVLDTTAPATVAVASTSQGITRVLRIDAVEPGARWEYSLDEQQTWLAGAGPGLGVLGNGLARIWLRQVDLAGNPSMAQPVPLDQPSDTAWHEASGNPLQPSVLSATGARTLVVHGSVVRGDPDYIRWDVPADHRVASLRLVQYVSEDLVAFYAIQRAAEFDAGVDVSRMLVFGHMGPDDLQRNVLGAVAPEVLGPGPMTLWFQQTGPLPTRYAFELVLQPLRD